MQTIMITGCSSGFGLETARYFLEQGWNVNDAGFNSTASLAISGVEEVTAISNRQG